MISWVHGGALCDDLAGEIRGVNRGKRSPKKYSPVITMLAVHMIVIEIAAFLGFFESL